MSADGRKPADAPPRHAHEDLDFRSLVELLPTAVYTCDAPSGTISYYNARAAALWGRSPNVGDTDERFCGSFRLWRPDGSQLQHDQTPMALAVREGRAFRNEEVTIERPDGSRAIVRVNIDPIRDASGQVIGAINVFSDVTSVKLAGETRARLAAIVESSDDAIISKDLQGVITSWNRGAQRIFGYSAVEAIGQPVTMLIPADRQSEEPGILQRIRRGERIEHYETIRRRKDGTLVDISLTVSPVLDDSGRVVGASKIARDVTERNQAAARAALDRQRADAQQEELLRIAQRARDDAEAANRAKDEFLAMLGHELRNPLSAVRNATAVAMLDDTSRSRALEIARRQTDQLVRIVDDLLDVARITRGRVPMRKARITLGEVLRRTVDGARAMMDEQGLKLTLALPRETIHLDADADRIEQAVSNLLANSAKFTDRGGTVAVVGERHGDEAVIRVRDNGIGIAPQMLSKVFELFAQGDRSLDRPQGGLGIGLTLVRRIVELHGGTVDAASGGPGAGAEFVIRLPAVSAAAAGAAARVVAERPSPKRPAPTAQVARVLVVEDNLDAAESLVMMLELLGHHVRVAYEGRTALDNARANVPDVMLIDIGLPGLSGYEIARAVRQDAALRQVLLVAITGYGRPEDKTQAMEAGFDYHLAKPVDLDRLAEIVARAGRRATA